MDEILSEEPQNPAMSAQNQQEINQNQPNPEQQQAKGAKGKIKRNQVAEQLFSINSKFRETNPTHEEWIEIIESHENLKAIDIGKAIEHLTGYRKYLKELISGKKKLIGQKRSYRQMSMAQQEGSEQEADCKEVNAHDLLR